MDKYEFVLRKMASEDGKKYIWDFMRFIGDNLKKIPNQTILSEQAHAAIVLEGANHFNVQVILAYFLDYCEQLKGKKKPRIPQKEKFFLPILVKEILINNGIIFRESLAPAPEEK